MNTEPQASDGKPQSFFIRAYVEANPDIRARAVADALGLDARGVVNHMAHMARLGLLLCSGERLDRKYRIGRPMLKDWAISPEELHKRRMARQAKRRKTATLRVLLSDLVIRATPTVAYNAPAQSYEDWVAQGNAPEVLRGFQYVQPSALPMGARA